MKKKKLLKQKDKIFFQLDDSQIQQKIISQLNIFSSQKMHWVEFDPSWSFIEIFLSWTDKG